MFVAAMAASLLLGCETPSDAEVLEGLPCDDGKCLDGFVCNSAGNCVRGIEPKSPEAGPMEAAYDRCSNGVTDPDERDVDCGGSCPPCGPFAYCEGWDTDCATGLVCIQEPNDSASEPGGHCRSFTCANGVLDERESEVDCGGGGCMECPRDGCTVRAECPPITPRNCRAEFQCVEEL